MVSDLWVKVEGEQMLCSKIHFCKYLSGSTVYLCCVVSSECFSSSSCYPPGRGGCIRLSHDQLGTLDAQVPFVSAWRAEVICLERLSVSHACHCAMAQFSRSSVPRATEMNKIFLLTRNESSSREIESTRKCMGSRSFKGVTKGFWTRNLCFKWRECFWLLGLKCELHW